MIAKRIYTLRHSGAQTKSILATPQQAAREAARFAARGTYIRSKTMWEQPEGAHGGKPVALLLDGEVLMTCVPTLSATRLRTAKQMFARCDIKPSFKRQIKKRKKRR